MPKHDQIVKNERVVIVSKMGWERFLAGHSKTLTIYGERDLHHEFGDDPEPNIVRIKITEL